MLSAIHGVDIRPVSQQKFDILSLPKYGYVHQQRVSGIIRAFYVSSIRDGAPHSDDVSISQGLQQGLSGRIRAKPGRPERGDQRIVQQSASDHRCSSIS
jgi:hypothetical protein